MPPYKYHDQPEHLEHVINDINHELVDTTHGLTFGERATLLFLATITWTSKKDHPARYATVNPSFAKHSTMAAMMGTSKRSVGTYLSGLEDKDWIRREAQYGPDGHRQQDRIWLRWTDQDRKVRRVNTGDDVREPVGMRFTEDKPKAEKYVNDYWVAPSGQFWRTDNLKHKVADNEETVTLTSAESRFFWSKTYKLDTTQRRKIMTWLLQPGGHAKLGRMMASAEARSQRRSEED